MLNLTRRRVLKMSLDGVTEAKWMEDEVAVDVLREIFIGNELFQMLLASPGKQKELAVGHLLAEGIIDSYNEVEKIVCKGSKIFITLNTDRRLRLETSKVTHAVISSCGGVTSNMTNLLDRLRRIRVSYQIQVKHIFILSLIRELNLRAEVFKATGGTHCAMLCKEDGEVLAYSEDVGRHNAVDKVIGELALEDGEFSNCILVSSGRQSSYMVLKAARVGIPIVVSQAGPLDSGVKVAEETGITLICFARGKRMNIYTHPERLLLDHDRDAEVEG